MTTEYYFWEGNTIVRKSSLPEIRKTFIKKHGKNHATNIFRKGHSGYPAGRIYYVGGDWIYDNYENDNKYITNENGNVIENLGRRYII